MNSRDIKILGDFKATGQFRASPDGMTITLGKPTAYTNDDAKRYLVLIAQIACNSLPQKLMPEEIEEAINQLFYIMGLIGDNIEDTKNTVFVAQNGIKQTIEDIDNRLVETDKLAFNANEKSDANSIRLQAQKEYVDEMNTRIMVLLRV
jgi:hypothetical protein